MDTLDSLAALLDVDATYHRPGADRLLDDLAALRVEEDGEDTFTPTPAKCLRYGCGGHVLPAGGFHRCMKCGGSYGPVDRAAEDDAGDLLSATERGDRCETL